MKNTLFVLFIFCSSLLVGQEINPDTYKSMRHSSLKSDINLYYNPLMDNYNIYFVKLDLDVSDQSTDIKGNVIIQSKTNKELDTLLFDFSNEMILDSFLINEKKVDASHAENRIEYIFDSPLSANEDFKTQIFYHGTPCQNCGGVTQGYSATWDKNMTYTLSESFHAYEWWPCKQVLSDKIDSAYIFLTCDNDCMAGSNGLLDQVVDLPNNKKRFEWKTFYPINYYLISFAVAEYQDYSIYAKPEGADSILIQNFVYNNPNYLNENKAGIDNTIDFIELFSEKFGLYPFSNEKYGHCLTTLGGGMEHQTMTTIGSFSSGWYNVVSHELGHMWFGDYVTCASWQDIWINEGFASYTEYVTLENLQTQSAAQSWMNSAHTNSLTQPQGSVYVPFDEVFNENRIFSGSLSYDKGAAIIHMIRFIINNDELFFSSLRNYLSEYADSVATGEDFKNSIENSTGIDLDPFFDQWYYGKGYPKFDLEYFQKNDSLYINVNQSTSSSETPLFQIDVDLKILFTEGDTLLRLFQETNHETFKIETEKTVAGIVVDPDNWILNQPGTVKKIETVGVFELLSSNESMFLLYPNPAKDHIFINFSDDFFDKEKEIQLMDVNGRQVKFFSTNSDHLSIDISNLSDGFYFIKGTSNNNSHVIKFVKH